MNAHRIVTLQLGSITAYKNLESQSCTLETIEINSENLQLSAMSPDYTKLLVARYLEENGFTNTLSAFLDETDLSLVDLNNVALSGERMKLTELVKDRIKFDEQLLLKKERNRADNEFPLTKWNYRNTFKCEELEQSKSLPVTAKLVLLPTKELYLLISKANKTTTVMKFSSDCKWESNNIIQHDNICKEIGYFEGTNCCYFISIDGKLVTYDILNTTMLQTFPLNTRMVSHAKIIPSNIKGRWYLSYCGLDSKLRVAEIILKQDDTFDLNILNQVQLLSKCTAIEATLHPETGDPVIFVSRFEYSSILVFCMTQANTILHLSNIALNDAQFMSHSFHGLDMTINENASNPKKSQIVVATSHTPFMRLIVINLRDIWKEIPSMLSEETFTSYNSIILNMLTNIPQDSYSQPILEWSDREKGLIVGSNDGLYAVDLSKNDSWQLSTYFANRRIKLLTSDHRGLLVVGTADKALFSCSFVKMS